MRSVKYKAVSTASPRPYVDIVHGAFNAIVALLGGPFSFKERNTATLRKIAEFVIAYLVCLFIYVIHNCQNMTPTYLSSENESDPVDRTSANQNWKVEK